MKSQNTVEDEAVVAKPAKSRPGMALPLPIEDIADQRTELKFAPVLPDAPEAPRWIVPARPVPEPLDDDVTTVEISATSVPAQAVVVPQETISPPVVAVAQDPPAAAEQPATPVATEPPAVPNQKPGGSPRKLRSIQEISPFYDTSVDKDIRDFAEQRAAEYNVAFGAQTFHPRDFPDTMYPWEPSNFYHYPLYFEDPALERYGHTRHPLVQPIASVARFGTQLVFLPYQMTIDPINRPMYALGWYRPGDCAPKLRYQPELNAKAAAVEVGVWTGLFFLVP